MFKVNIKDISTDFIPCSALLNFNLFGNVLHRKQTNQRRISDLHIICDGVLCDNIMSESQFVLTKQLHLK